MGRGRGQSDQNSQPGPAPRQMPWLDAYVPHDWTVHTVPLEEVEQISSLVRQLSETEVFSCGAESGAAAERWRQTGTLENTFYFDFEQLAMGLDRAYGVADFGVLTEPWHQHQPGALLLSVFSGVTAQPATMTIAVADTSPLLTSS